MEIAGVNNWRSALILAPMVVGDEQQMVREFTLQLKEVNEALHIDVVHWQNDKKRAKAKEYVRLVNEINDTDFTWLGKLNNPQLLPYFSDQYDCLIVLTDELPVKFIKLIQGANAALKIGFEENEAYMLVFKSGEKALEHKLATLRKHLLKNILQ